MTASFSLAGLLRLRRLEEQQAAVAFGAATGRHAGAAARVERAYAELDRLDAEADSLTVLETLAASRAAQSAMLAELNTLTEVTEAELRCAEQEFGAARGRTLGLEKLEARHAAGVHAAELAAEQVVLDELGSAARLRAVGEGSAP